MVSPCLTLSPSISLSLPQSHPVSISLPQSPSVSPRLSQSHPVSLSLPQSPSVSLSLTPSLSVSPRLSQSHPVSLSLPQSPSVSLSLPQSPSVSLSLTPSLSVSPRLSQSHPVSLSLTLSLSVSLSFLSSIMKESKFSEEDLFQKLDASKYTLELSAVTLDGALALDESQHESIKGLCELFHESALQSVDRARYYRIIKTQKFFRKVNNHVGTTAVLLCMLSFNTTEIQKFDLNNDFPRLQEWCRNNPVKDFLKDLAKTIYDQYDLKRLFQATIKPSENSQVTVTGDTPNFNQEARNSVDQPYEHVTLQISDVPGLQLSLLTGQTVFELNILQLIAWIHQYESMTSNPEQVASILQILQDYQANCPGLQLIQLILPWHGNSAYIDMKIDSTVRLSARMELSLTQAYNLTQFACNSWTRTTETADDGVTH
ncbi:hypothetical protein N7494_005354 [Penicillium frequentans]|uniref:Uncharacterized protein n=1 Tax=Penicillium frequentans TaxID=3151616 RepID=A0AAD6CXX0_9EURO|nr:hypothetical protein N7494_005354 [Penicillium glabrum]